MGINKKKTESELTVELELKSKTGLVSVSMIARLLDIENRELIICPGGWSHGLIPGVRIVSGENEFLYRGIGSSRFDCGDTRAEEGCFGTLNVCEDMDDKIDDVY
ncbi:hypothetical protein EVAR_19744_1 [Eumeta japonica]|uniref:Uncharacterized protein n=1 Tax=Eumeta variegata TaxID=151549 RepID=A0A4C1UQG0_EUMVA|nr:hypothetical protein EVAR_19744_1 [Eumeta japonica]